MALGLALSSCASTSGQEWLNSPIDQRAESATVTAMDPAVAPEARPRLSHTVTLGESYEVAQDAPAAVGAAPSVQVNVHTPVVINNYAGYGYGGYGYYPSAYGSASSAPVRATRSADVKVGADFPAPPSYGPRALK